MQPRELSQEFVVRQILKEAKISLSVNEIIIKSNSGNVPLGSLFTMLNPEKFNTVIAALKKEAKSLKNDNVGEVISKALYPDYRTGKEFRIKQNATEKTSRQELINQLDASIYSVTKRIIEILANKQYWNKQLPSGGVEVPLSFGSDATIKVSHTIAKLMNILPVLGNTKAIDAFPYLSQYALIAKDIPPFEKKFWGGERTADTEAFYQALKKLYVFLTNIDITKSKKSTGSTIEGEESISIDNEFYLKNVNENNVDEQLKTLINGLNNVYQELNNIYVKIKEAPEIATSLQPPKKNFNAT